MGIVQVDAAGLHALAERAEGLASELSGSSELPVSGPSWQPSVTAVSAVNVLVADAAGSLASRMSKTAEKLTASSSLYSSQDDRAASAIRTYTV